MNRQLIVGILDQCLTVYKGVLPKEIPGVRRILPEYGEAPAAESLTDNQVLVDCYYVKVVVDLGKAGRRKAELVQELRRWPTEAFGQPIRPMAEDLDFQSAGLALDSQDYALQLFGLGQALGMWTVLTPNTFGDLGAVVAGAGLVIISIHGFKAFD